MIFLIIINLISNKYSINLLNSIEVTTNDIVSIKVNINKCFLTMPFWNLENVINPPIINLH